jgi:membrane protein implicated in regulation of membrane protease activity
MTKLLIFAGMTIGSYAGWALGAVLGLGFFWDFVLSGVASVAGVYYGWKFAQKLDR